MRRLAALAVAALVGATGLVVATAPAPAEAHGAEVFPGSRQYLCYLDGLTASGSVDPQNPACADAYAADGTAAFYNWFGNLDSNGAGRTEGYIPDGQICDGGGNGPYDFSSFNAVRDDWPTTHLTAGATYEFQHNNWAEHPGRFDVYVTEQGWDPGSPLAWSDLELIDSATNPPDTGGPGGDNYYYWDVTLPADRSGDHIVFTHWVRSDSNENFYSCSDVAFDGGDGEVTGIDGDLPDDGGDPVCPDESPGVPGDVMASDVHATSAHLMWGVAQDGCITGYDVVDPASGEVLASTDGSPMVDLTGLEPETTYSVAVQARNDNTGEVSATTDAVSFTTAAEDDDPPPAGDCTAEVSVVNAWSGGYQADLVVTAGADPLTGWEVTVDGATVDQAWSAQVTGNVFTNVSWNGSLAAGASTSAGFIGSGDPDALSAVCSAA
ncbi:lytic polysaccharide monooxygenase [Isoptericola sp. S6320L]|uniref:lytic polysaccharide monooxygenase n=1 Tax=Isoptericola sp. S6320L TaxID=2926411 RepID=UPI001FF1D77A|nr:lytic polysaccharide monooxygenase [Isoptericola sp. S6320L]MCK0115820.1 lytic polysaccharide monooxygenase [Isoptericola sp. S6320L]